MSVKAYQLDGIGPVQIYKRKGTRSLRLSITADGSVRVTVPASVSYDAGVRFAQSRQAWIEDHLPQPKAVLGQGHHIGKAHRLVFATAETDTVRTRIAGSDIIISRPPGILISHPKAQEAATRASLRALRAEAQKLLPPRLRQLSEEYGFNYSSVSVKQLTGRWGSCDAKHHIVLNLFLMQLPWHLIDYVLVHELTHTKHLDHSAAFWQEFLRHEPRARTYQKEIRHYKPILAAIEAGGDMS